jgi:Gpi18-like mannosyltransferase
MGRMKQQSSARQLFWLFGTTRLLLIFMTYVTYCLFTAPEKYSNDPVNLFGLLSTWNRWDAENYIRIAQYGYQQIYDLAFFPLFPWLTAVLSYPLGDWSYLLSGMLISNAALLGTLFVLYTLAAEDWGEEIAHRTLWYFCLFPTAFFFFTAYNESLYLFFAAGTFLALRRQRWWLAGLLGLLAALTRSVGVFLVLPYLYELWSQRAQLLPLSPGKIWRNLLPIALIPTGTAIFALFCWFTFGDPLAFMKVQEHWSRTLSWPWQGLWQAISALFLPSSQAFGSSNQAHLLLDLSAAIGFIALIVVGWRKIRVSYSLWMACFFFFTLLTPAMAKPDILLSTQRFVLELFPAFITLALLGKSRPRLHQALILLFPTLQAVMGIAFLLTRWMV